MFVLFVSKRKHTKTVSPRCRCYFLGAVWLVTQSAVGPHPCYLIVHWLGQLREFDRHVVEQLVLLCGEARVRHGARREPMFAQVGVQRGGQFGKIVVSM